jgi:hypothetical protein
LPVKARVKDVGCVLLLPEREGGKLFAGRMREIHIKRMNGNAIDLAR